MNPIRSVNQLTDVAANGVRPNYLFFWGHAPAPGGRITSSCFSQWWLSPFTVDGVDYRTAEHFMMASKARLFGDERILERILACEQPRQAKELGREVAGFREADWVRERFPLVVVGNMAKFSQHDDLRGFLLGTEDRVLVEASPHDRIWGIGLAADDRRARNPTEWRGLNLLGFALMEVRERLRGE